MPLYCFYIIAFYKSSIFQFFYSAIIKNMVFFTIINKLIFLIMFCFRCPLIMHNRSVYQRSVYQRSVCRPIWTQPYKVPVFQTLLYILSSCIVLIQLSLPNSPLPLLASQKAFPKPTFSHCLLLRRKCAGASVIRQLQIFHHHSIMKSVKTLHVGQNVRLVYSLVEARSQNG